MATHWHANALANDDLDQNLNQRDAEPRRVDSESVLAKQGQDHTVTGLGRCGRGHHGHCDAVMRMKIMKLRPRVRMQDTRPPAFAVSHLLRESVSQVYKTYAL